MKENLPIKPDYVERGDVMTAGAIAAELAQITELYGRFDAGAKVFERKAIETANLGREIGLVFQAASGHELLDEDFWKQHCQGKLPFDFEQGKIFVRIARKMPKKAETIADCMQFTQALMVADGILELEERAEAQTRAVVSVMEKFLAGLSIIKVPLAKMQRDTPVKQWSESAARQFLYQTQWLVPIREEAEARLKELKPKL